MQQPMDLIDLGNVPGYPFITHDYEVVQRLRQGHNRFYAYRLETRDTTPYYGKQISPWIKTEEYDNLVQRLRRQVQYYRHINSLASLKGIVRCPEINVASSNHFFVSEWFHKPFYPECGTELTNLRLLTPRQITPNVGTFAHVLAELDLAAELSQPPGHTVPRLSDVLNSGGITLALETRLLTARMLEKARTVIDIHQRYVVPRFQHTDLQPLHFFHLGMGKTGLIDSERSDFSNACYADLAEMYCRIFTLVGATIEVSDMLATFIRRRQLELNPFWQAFRSPFTACAARMVADAAIHYKYENIDYRQRAMELFRIGVNGKIEDLLQ
jgi:hypothetical protein